MFNLMRNENMKIYRRGSTWVMIGILIVVIAGMGVIFKAQFKSDASQNWRTSTTTEVDAIKQSLKQENIPVGARNMMEQQLAVGEYRLAHDIPPIEPNTIWGFMDATSNLMGLITLFTIVIGAGMVASEFTWGTIKLLLIRPVNRTKILLSKYLTTFLFTLFMLALLFLISFLVGFLLFGLGEISTPFLAYWGGKVVELPMALNILIQYGFGSVDLLMMATFAFMISSVFRSNALAVGLSIFLLFAGSSAVGILSQFQNNNWVKYILFANTDLRVYFNGTPPIEGMTLSFSITVLAVYYILFNLLSWLFFKKRDVTA